MAHSYELCINKDLIIYMFLDKVNNGNDKYPDKCD